MTSAGKYHMTSAGKYHMTSNDSTQSQSSIQPPPVKQLGPVSPPGVLASKPSHPSLVMEVDDGLLNCDGLLKRDCLNACHLNFMWTFMNVYAFIKYILSS